MLVLFGVLLVGAGVSATTPRRPPPKCPFPSGPYVQPKCGHNEYFEVCSYPSPPQNCSTLWTKYSRLETCCKPECRCKDGFLRDDKSGKCIRRDECFNPCGLREHFVQGSTECRKTCANRKVTGPQSLCKPFTGCVCNEGRVRLNDDATGVCIPPQQCPTRKCPIFEHLEDCPSVCQKETCISKNPDYKCLLPANPLPCKPRCICDRGFLRNAFGHCIPENHCPVKKCPINEDWRCASMCAQDSCKTLEPGFKCPPGVISICIPVCGCKDGYLRNDKGHCVPRELCPASLRCGINEVAVACATALPLQSCESVYTLYKPVKDIPCKPGCDCRPGYLRNKHNICVPSEFCPTVPHNQCGPNQEYKKCGSACEPSCADLDNPNLVCTDQCVAGCFCKEGYLKDDEGNCIPRDQCPLPVCTQPNEVATECGSDCNVRNCEDYNRTDIVCPAVCVRGCFCKPDYVRNAYGICIPIDQCPPTPVCLQANEEYQSCGSSCPDNCDNYQDTERICTANCVPACNCKQGFVRNLQDKTCVKPEQCPSKNCTGLNESLNLCASYCPVTCANRFTNGDWLCATVCRVACDCIPGTLRNDSGVCVPVEECTPPVCRQNEKFLNCGTACPLTCDNYKSPPEVCTRQCVEGCFCEDGYVRDRHMRCVKPENCEPICPAGEKFNECSAHCQDTCENFDKPDRICTYQCQSGCVCEAGTVRRKDGKCVPPLECSSQPTCSNLTEVYSPCSAHCEPTCENSNPNQPCTRICKPGCKCIDGLVRRKDGQCVKVEECLPQNQCGPNQEYNECGSDCEPSCAKLAVSSQVCTDRCVAGCFCKEGYLKDDQGNCITRDQCPSQPTCSNPTEVYSPCSAHCEPTCENSSPNQPCTRICKPGCKCIDGLVRRKDGQCVKVEECLPQNQCGPNQEYNECGTACEPSCANLDNPNQVCTDQCVAGCFCKEGYFKDDQGNCIPRDQCPLPVCPQPNEVATECGSGCKDRTCENYNRTDIVCPAVCIRGCFCKPGYVRNADGVCIPIDQCPSQPTCSNPTEVYSPCSAHCEPTCENSSPNQPCTRICKPGCKCIDGLVRRKDGQCVKVEECLPQNQCGPNQEYNECGTACEPSCANLDVSSQVCTDQCVAGCFCKEGYFKDDQGNCVPRDQCPLPVCPQPNEVATECGSGCNDRTCENYNRTDIVCPAVCIRGCFCKPGYVRNADGVCIPIDQCPSQPKCSNPTEVYSPCSAHCEPTCENSSPNQRCSRICKPGCKCIDGLVRRKDGQCVKVEECSQPQCSGDEVYDACSAHCEPTCENHGPNRVCTAICIPGCKCGEGLVRRKDGQCVKIKDCSAEPSCPAQEVYDPCSAHCEPTCENNGPNRACTDICSPGCKCEDGLVRRSDGKCVKLEECQYTPECPLNERWVNCVIGLCAPKTCDELGYPVACPGIIGPCRGGCVCAEDYLRDSEGVCIPQRNCPKCGVDFNATSGCGNNCGNHCSNYDKPNNCSSLPLFCQYNGCDCKDGYVFDDVTEKCISPSDCPNKNQPCSDPNAERVECATQCPLTCSNPVPGPCIASCKLNACVCKKGFILSEDGGNCVPVDQCPKDAPCNGDSNAVIKANPLPCPSTCAAPNASPYCKKYAPEVGCECKPGYLKSSDDIDGKCIKPEECPGGNPCGVNGTFALCNAGCPNNICPVNDNRGIIACSPPRPCPSGCACKLNYRKKSYEDQTCILASECPPVKCTRQNEEWSRCTPACLRENCEDVNNQASTCNTLVLNCQPQCICKKGYFRSSAGLCIPAKQCPKPLICKENEVYNPCRIICPPQTCASIYTSYDCQENISCEPGCDCISEYLRNGTVKDLCIPSSQCPPFNNNQCSDPNAERVECAPAPQCRSTCAAPNPGPCILSCALNECVCKKGFVLSEKGGKCVPVDQCPKDAPCNGDSNAMIKANPLPCPSTCAAPNASPYCKKYAPEIGCECKPGYLKSDDNGKCIKPDDCKGGNPCGKNGTFVWCNAGCPNNKCPVNDNRGIIACSPPYPCPSGCACKLNYRRKSSDDDTCILASDCPPVKCTRQNEEWSRCTSACLRENCEDVNNQASTCNTLVLNCQPQCICKKGHFRNSDGLCIPAKQCPKPIKCKANEVYNPCRIICPPQTCASIYTSYSCQEGIKCEPGCDCISEYLRNGTDKDLCIPSSQCPAPPPRCNENETYSSCGTACPETCLGRGGNCTTLCTKQCVEGCFCSKGFLRAADGTCVKPKDCPKPTCSDPNEVFQKCPSTCPPGDECSNLWTKFDCSKFENCCKPACRCKSGYYRKNGKCVTTQQCTTPACGLNEHYEENQRKCDLTCKNKDREALIGPCLETSGCFCDDGFYRNTNGICVSKEQCPPPRCNENETYSSCGTACPETCLGRGGNCTTLCTKQCVEGCFCSKGFLRAADGTCVKPKDCPKPTCSDPNEVFQKCPSTCPPGDECSNLWTKFDCSKFENCCKPACRCKSGYYRKNGKCVTTQQCTTPACGLNEHYEENQRKCDLTCKNKDREALIGPCLETSGCFCDDGFYRNTNGICVSKEQCPKPTTCPANEVLSECYNACQTTCKTRIRGDGRACSLACIATGCVCKQGYLRHDNGTCVPVSECSPPRCNENETYSSCGTACPETCLGRGGNCTTLCTKQCVEGCFCSKGFLRADDGTCVKPKDCPKPTCSDPNEVFQKCPSTCPPGDECSNLWSKFDCSKFENCCKPACRCKSGYYRKNGKCITTQQCIHGEDATEEPEVSE